MKKHPYPKFGLVTTWRSFLPLTDDPQSGFPVQPAILAGCKIMKEWGKVPLQVIQFPFFGFMTDEENAAKSDSLVEGLGGLCEELVPIIMSDADLHSGNYEQEEAYVETIAGGLSWAGKKGCRRACATLFEKWMSGNARISDADLPEANKRLAKLVAEGVKRAKERGPVPDEFHAEYLRPDKNGQPGEFSTYTDINRALWGVEAINEEIGGDVAFVRLMHDIAHAGDSLLSLEAIGKALVRMRDAGLTGITHASAPTTRGCLVDQSPWVIASLQQAAMLGVLETVLGEVFHWKDQLLNPLRADNIGFGKDTFNGRDGDSVMADNQTFTKAIVDAQVENGILEKAS